MEFFREWKVKNEIKRNAMRMAEEHYKKDVQKRKLEMSDLSFPIIQDLMQAAHFAGKVTLKFRDGTEMVIEPKPERQQLDEIARSLF